MHNLQDYFAHQPDSHRIAVLTISIFVFWNIENALALDMNYKKWRHALTNSYFMLVDAPVQFVLGVALAFATGWVAMHQFGLIYWLPLPNVFTQFVVSFVLLDLLEYVYHRFMHIFTPLWMVHLVHHSDRNLDSSTVLREHPLETGVRLTLLVLWVFVTGAGLWMVLARQFFQVISNVFTHSNFRLNDKLDRVLSLLIVTPNMHHVHHHYQQPYTDTNYGDVLSVWDRIFGTFSRLSADEVVFGVDTHMALEENADFKNLLAMPFGPHRESEDFSEEWVWQNA
ncbi:sterol desaturase family protein [Rhabdobacter roseus]|uniref:Sterol desaturase/sphingolipid hydroxylase (Fatty acid hydroxylase superfamily) n=1 Tax=Rhabdobacter roseus TaxID=1655419 RepID=A0A840TUT5_9BACT|nr:sterol desaturase family protein [Rhabdobacter roseus]MBB5287004.1 sterol desaturase/sphingolipid hydroxylase (fatty acid hydroxylase superfamily) [Rhabdobacter roseus]